VQGRDAGPSAWLVATGLVGAVAVVYANALGNDFVFDDFLLIIDDPAVRVPLSDGWEMLRYRPMRMLSYRLDYAIGGMNEWIFHLSNVIYHAITVLLVHAVLRRLGASGWGAMAGALVFAVHPLQTESVTYASGRRDVLCGLFFVAGFLAFLRARARGSWLALMGAGTAWGLAVLTKEMAATLPLICILVHGFERKRETGSVVSLTAAFRPALVLPLLGLVVAVVVRLTTYREFTTKILAEMPWHGGSIGANFATVARIWVHYLKLIVWPAHLSVDYTHNAFPVSTSATDPVAMAAAAFLVALAAAAFWRWRAGGLAGFGFAWFAVALLPVSHFIPYVEMVAEHYLYIPLVGIAMIVADAVDVLEARMPEQRWALVAAILLMTTALGARSVVRNRDWRDGPTLWAATVAVVPNCARARFNLGEVWLRRGKRDEAERLWRAGAADFPHAYTYPFSLAKLAYRAGDYDQAYWEIKRAIRLRPQEGEARSLAGWISLHGGRPQRAIGFFDAALARLPLAEASGAAKGRARALAVAPAAREATP